MQNTENISNPINNAETQDQSSHKFWLGLEQYNQDTEFAKKAESEFLSSPYKEEDGKDGFARREFLKLMGASIAMATTGCIRRPVQHIIPYAQAPKEITPGEASYYASTWFDGTEGAGLLVKTLDGRPIKVEGNPNHPMNRGGLTARAHAEILSLYDPDRLRGPKRNLLNKARTSFETVNVKYEEADQKIQAALAKSPTAFLTPSIVSPSLNALLSEVSHLWGAKHFVVDSISSSVREAQKNSYGKEVLPRYRLDLAKIIVSIDCDFLGTYLSPAEFTRDFSQSRKPGHEMNRLVAFESVVSLTGMNADDRVRIKPSQQLDVALALVHHLNHKQASKFVTPAIKDFVAKYADVPAKLSIAPELWEKLVQDLLSHKGSSLVISGGISSEGPNAVELHTAVNLLNSMLENDGKTVDHENAYNSAAGSASELQKLITEIESGKIKNLVVYDNNYVYQLPAAFKKALAKLDLVIYLGNYNNAMGAQAHYVLPIGSPLETWADYELQKSVYSIGQPTIRPMYDTRSIGETILAWAKLDAKAPAKLKQSWYEYFQAFVKSEIHRKYSSKSFDEFWYELLQTGVAGKAKTSGVARSFQTSALSLKPAKANDGLELSLYSSVQLGDGKYANVSWLHELPDAVSKVVWDNYVSVSPATAVKHKLKKDQVIEIQVGEVKVKLPVLLQPGQADDVLAVAIGYGQKSIGKVGSEIGIDAFQFASYKDGKIVYAGLPVQFKTTGESYPLVSTQTHHSMEGRQIVVETTNEAFAKNKSSGIEKVKLFSIWPEHQYTQHKWGMSIDLNTCTGCSACVIACQSENNVPVVGKKYVMQGREMHWIRIDRYYKGEAENPDTVFQPMLCQQCENAPCETVCPVAATVHNEEGLNDMVYNRCVGTRYCSNNCPYKVRRFNWFNFEKRAEPLHMALNPDVTVRSRGVMEKCTFCVQRIRKVTNEAKDTGEKLKDGAVKTACEESCPAQAIVFGDLNDANSRIAKLFAAENSYGSLEDLNTKPRVRYSSKVRNAVRADEEAEETEKPEHKEDKKEKKADHASTKIVQQQGEWV